MPDNLTDLVPVGVAGALYYITACGGFVIAGPYLILLNNQLLHDRDFPFPIALSALGVGFTAVMSRLLPGLRVLKLTQPKLVGSWSFYLRSALPIASLSASTLALGTASYIYLSVAMCQMLKSLAPVVTLLLLFLLQIEVPSRAEVACVLVITLGTIVTTQGELSLSRFGLALQLSAVFAEASRLVLSQQLLANMKLPLMEMQYHVAPPQFACLLLASAVFELWNAADRQKAVAAVVADPAPFALAGVLGLLLQVVGLMAVKAAGSVAVKLLGIARNAGLVLFEVFRGGGDRAPTHLQLAGYTASVGSFFVYTLVRLRRPSKQKAS